MSESMKQQENYQEYLSAENDPRVPQVPDVVTIPPVQDPAPANDERG